MSRRRDCTINRNGQSLVLVWTAAARTATGLRLDSLYKRERERERERVEEGAVSDTTIVGKSETIFSV
jgi:hypothetical protein